MTPQSTFIVAVGSRSPAKVEAVEVAWRRYPELRGGRDELRIYTLPPGVDPAAAARVAANPTNLADMVRGAEARARAAHDHARREIGACDHAVGLEAGIELVAGCPMNLSVAVVFDGRETTMGFSPAFEIPPRAWERVLGGEELGEMSDIFGPTGKEREGIVGPLTGGHVLRIDMDVMAVSMALAPIVSAPLYAGRTTAPAADPAASTPQPPPPTGVVPAG